MVMLPPPIDRPVSIAVAGTHSTGKSTFLARVAHEARRGGLAVATVADLGEQAQRLGFPILHRHTWASTLWIITQGISNELAAWIGADVVLVDRPVPDALGYYRAALAYRGERPDATIADYLNDLVRTHAAHAYDLIFHTHLDPARPISQQSQGPDKARDPSEHFRTLADHYVARVLHDLPGPTEQLGIDDHDSDVVRALNYITAHHHTRCELTSSKAAVPGPGELP